MWYPTHILALQTSSSQPGVMVAQPRWMCTSSQLSSRALSTRLPLPLDTPWRLGSSANSPPTSQLAGQQEWTSCPSWLRLWEVWARTQSKLSAPSGSLSPSRSAIRTPPAPPASFSDDSPSPCGGGMRAFGSTVILPSPPLWTVSFSFVLFFFCFVLFVLFCFCFFVFVFFLVFWFFSLFFFCVLCLFFCIVTVPLVHFCLKQYCIVLCCIHIM